MASKAGSVPHFRVEPHSIHAATTDEAIKKLLVSLGMQRREITPQHINEARATMLESYYRANAVAERSVNREIGKEFAQARKFGTSEEEALDRALVNGMQKTGEKFDKIKDRECEACGKSALGQALQKCAHCFTAHYCGKECQEPHWKQHKAEWLQHDAVIKEKLVAHQPKFVAYEVTGGFTSELCQLIADYDHVPAKAKS